MSNLIKEIEKGNVSAFYKSTVWLNKRSYILKRDNFECQICKSEGKYHKAECVHHLKHLRDRPDLALIDTNLLSVCNSCHNFLHPEKLNNNYKHKFKNEERW